MKARTLGVALLIAMGIGTAGWLHGTRSATAYAISALSESTETGTASRTMPASRLPASATTTPGNRPATSAMVTPAWQSMANAREHGDDRAPPIERPSPDALAPAPTAWDLGSPERYREYERRNQANLRAEYLVALEAELPKLKAMVAQARTTGAPPAAIREMEEKIRHLEHRQVLLRSSAGATR